MKIQGKIIWITGASSGIGEALAYEFSKYQVKLILSARNTDKLDEVKTVCESNGSTCMCVHLELTREESIQAAFDTVIQHFEKVDIMVHNGGVSQRATVVETPLEVERKLMETNYWGPVTLTKKLLPSMIKQQGGHFVVISSIVGKFGFPLRSTYSATKHALVGYFESLRAETKKDQVGVTIVSPGRINTNISFNAIDSKGEKHGVMDQGQANGMPVDACARKIVKSVRRERKDVLVGRTELLMVFFRKFIPPLYYSLSSKVSAT